MTIPNDQEAIKPCPFCGSVEIYGTWISDSDALMLCEACLAQGPMCDNEEDALQAWNRRA